MTKVPTLASETISKNVRAERIRAGLSQQALAKRTGLSVRYISRLETQPQNIRIDKLYLIASALGIEPSALLGRSGASSGKNVGHIAHSLKTAIRLLESVHARVS